MKRGFLVLILSLATAACAMLGLTGCELPFGSGSGSILDNLFGDEHSPSTEWGADSTYHWYKCVDSECDEQFSMGEHVLAYVAASDMTCTKDGNVGHLVCTICRTCFSDINTMTILDDVVIPSTGHEVLDMYDDEGHWEVCASCGETISPKTKHSFSEYVKSKEGHYRGCMCGLKTDVGTHESGEDCSICGYSANYPDMCESDYGYNYLATLPKGAKYKSFYESIDKVARSFHDDGVKNAGLADLTNGKAYLAGEVRYASLGLTLNEAQGVWATYRNDHPLYYWLSSQVVYNSNTLSLCVDEEFIQGSVRAAQNELIYTAIEEYLKAVDGETSAYQTAFAFHDMIIDKIDYATDSAGNPQTADWAHNIVGVFCGSSAVCEGYAKAFALLLNIRNIENVYVTGMSKNVGHAWNMVKLEDGWYWYDLTWDDQPLIGRGVVYDYMCKSGETFADHTVNSTTITESGMSFLYALPQAATAEYDSFSLEYGEDFKIGDFTYEVCGYNKVSLKGTYMPVGAVTLAQNVNRNQRTYELVEIGSAAFSGDYWLTDLTIPKSVKVIYNFAFKDCSRLRYVTFEDVTGWCRTSSNGTQQVAESSLQSTTSAATILKETYNVGLTMYQYTWVKTLL